MPLPPTPNPLPGSTFQGGDGDQAAGPQGIDWATLRAAGRVEHSVDPEPPAPFIPSGAASANDEAPTPPAARAAGRSRVSPPRACGAARASS